MTVADVPVIAGRLQFVFLRRFGPMPTHSKTSHFERYGYNGHSQSDWAWIPELERELELHRLRILLAKKRQPDEFAALPLAEQLDHLRMARWIGRFFTDQRRQRAVCEVLGLPWPPRDRVRPFRWCWELRHEYEPDVPRPVVYPADWRADEIEPDLYGFGERWNAGEALVISPDEIPVDAEPLEDPPPTDTVGARIPEVIDVDAIEDSELEASAERAPSRSLTRMPLPPVRRGRQLGTVERDSFVAWRSGPRFDEW